MGPRTNKSLAGLAIGMAALLITAAVLGGALFSIRTDRNTDVLSERVDELTAANRELRQGNDLLVQQNKDLLTKNDRQQEQLELLIALLRKIDPEVQIPSPAPDPSNAPTPSTTPQPTNPPSPTRPTQAPGAPGPSSAPTKPDSPQLTSTGEPDPLCQLSGLLCDLLPRLLGDVFLQMSDDNAAERISLASRLGQRCLPQGVWDTH